MKPETTQQSGAKTVVLILNYSTLPFCKILTGGFIDKDLLYSKYSDYIEELECAGELFFLITLVPNGRGKEEKKTRRCLNNICLVV